MMIASKIAAVISIRFVEAESVGRKRRERGPGGVAPVPRRPNRFTVWSISRRRRRMSSRSANVLRSVEHTARLAAHDGISTGHSTFMPAHSTPFAIPSHKVSVQSLGSGSSGNAFLVTHGQETVLVDCGVGIRTIAKAFRERGLAFGDLSAVLVTHEHSDHIRTLPKVVTGELSLLATAGTARRSGIPAEQHRVLKGNTPVEVAGMVVWPLPVSHDAVEPCGYLLEVPGGTRVAILTDLGSWHESLVPYVTSCDLIVLEANHDEEMLRRGPYPNYLKKRVASDVGHLSNRACGIALGAALRGTSHGPDIWLAHLSETNNRPGLAVETVTAELRARDVDLHVMALPRLAPGPIWTPGQARPAPVAAARPLHQMMLEF
jgi:phosphoribosyl 1,2-cyclic phosphodiesterase